MTSSIDKKLVYVVDDEQDIQDIIRINLDYQNFNVATFSSAEEVLIALETEKKPDIMVLDIMMSGMDGYELCRRLRADERFALIPVLFLSAKSEEFDKVLGLELGADDYLTKPFSVKELTSRIKAILRRSSAQESVSKPEASNGTAILTFKGIEINTEQFSLKVMGKKVKLTKTEFEILHLFMRHPGKIYSRDNIIDSVRGNDVFVVDRTIDVHIMNLRKKLGPCKDLVVTYSGVGYGLKTDE